MNETHSAVIAQSVTVGSLLSNARNLAGLTLDEVANTLHLTVTAVEALEQNKFAKLPGTTFARGYIRSYAKLLELDATRLAQMFDQQIGAAAQVNAVHTIDRVGELRQISSGMQQFGLFLVFLLVSIAVYYGWQSSKTNALPTLQTLPAFERVEVERADGSVHVQTLDELEDQAIALALDNHASGFDSRPVDKSVASASVATESTAKPVKQVLTELPIALPLKPVATKTVTTALELPSAAVKVTPVMGSAEITFAHNCWLRVVDGNGKQIASGLKRRGETLKITGKAPLDVHLGYAKGVRILYNGEPVDFSSSVRGETARVKLGQ